MKRSHTVALFLILIALSTSGCLMRRTIKEGDHVVAEGYVVKPPLAPVMQ